jgi:hypothetical protein
MMIGFILKMLYYKIIQSMIEDLMKKKKFLKKLNIVLINIIKDPKRLQKFRIL